MQVLHLLEEARSGRPLLGPSQGGSPGPASHHPHHLPSAFSAITVSCALSTLPAAQQGSQAALRAADLTRCLRRRLAHTSLCPAATAEPAEAALATESALPATGVHVPARPGTAPALPCQCPRLAALRLAPKLRTLA